MESAGIEFAGEGRAGKGVLAKDSVDMTWRTAPILGTQDVDGAVAYYCDQLGFDCHAGPLGEPEGESVYAVVRRDGIEIHLQIRRHRLWDDDRNSIERSAYVYVPDVDVLHAQLTSNGANVVQAPTDMPYGMREIVVVDPQGHGVAFGSEPGVQRSAWEASPILGTNQVEASAAWFGDKLSFACPGGVFKPLAEGEAVYAIVLRQHAGIHLQIRRRAVFPVQREIIESDAYVFVNELDGLFEELTAKGVKTIRAPMDEPYGLRDFTIETQDGHRLAFATYL